MPPRPGRRGPCSPNGSPRKRSGPTGFHTKLAVGMVIDGLAIGEIIEPRGSRSLAGEFRSMPDSAASSELQPLLVSAAIALSAGRYDLSTASMGVAQGILDGLPGHQEAASRLAAAMIRLAASRRTGDLTGAAAAAASAEVLVDRLTDQKLARHAEIRSRVLSCRGAVELWSGRLGAAARVLDSGVGAATDSGAGYERADCLGYLALVEALRGAPSAQGRGGRPWRPPGQAGGRDSVPGRGACWRC